MYCVKGKWVSQKAAKYLSEHGFDVRSLDGGIDAWDAQSYGRCRIREWSPRIIDRRLATGELTKGQGLSIVTVGGSLCRGNAVTPLPVIAIAAIAAMLPLAACVELATSLAMVADDMSFADGSYYDDMSSSQPLTGSCPGNWEYGRVNNQTYQRVTNNADTTADYVLTYNTGYTVEVSLAPGETSAFFYMSGSITPDKVDVRC